MGKRKTQKSKMHCDDPATMEWLKVWHQQMFEHLGWMVLAESKGYMNDKVQSYKKSLLRLEDKLKCKIASVHDPDKKKDLEIMLNNVKVLVAHVMKDFK